MDRCCVDISGDCHTPSLNMMRACLRLCQLIKSAALRQYRHKCAQTSPCTGCPFRSPCMICSSLQASTGLYLCDSVHRLASSWKPCKVVSKEDACKVGDKQPPEGSLLCAAELSADTLQGTAQPLCGAAWSPDSKALLVANTGSKQLVALYFTQQPPGMEAQTFPVALPSSGMHAAHT